MPYTSNLNLPYPADTDYVANGYLDIQNLADAVDVLFGPSDTYTPATGNITSPTVTGNYRVIGKWMYVWVQISAGTVTTTGSITVELPLAANGAGRVQLVDAQHGGDLCRAYVNSNDTNITIFRDYTGANWNNGHSLATTRAQAWIEIQ